MVMRFSGAIGLLASFVLLGFLPAIFFVVWGVGDFVSYQSFHTHARNARLTGVYVKEQDASSFLVMKVYTYPVTKDGMTYSSNCSREAISFGKNHKAQDAADRVVLGTEHLVHLSKTRHNCVYREDLARKLKYGIIWLSLVGVYVLAFSLCCLNLPPDEDEDESATAYRPLAVTNPSGLGADADTDTEEADVRLGVRTGEQLITTVTSAPRQMEWLWRAMQYRPMQREF
jgi:hypothetical protein